MRLASIALILGLLGACDLGKVTVNTTAKVLVRAQPSIQMESDYELAHQAIPGTLKTIEGFWVVSPDNQQLIGLLTEGYCQYGTAFVEDDWEIASFAKDLDAAAESNDRATKMFTRCLNYALKTLGPRWQKEIFAEQSVVDKLIHDTGSSKRTAMMWAGVALGSMINHNTSRMEMLGNVATVEAIMRRVLELDKAHPPKNLVHAALPHIALGMLLTARPKALGGTPEVAKTEFETAIQITGGKFLLPRALLAYRVGLAMNDRALFHEQLKTIIETDPAIWPEQRLANEVAHRKARRYLKHEKELFQ